MDRVGRGSVGSARCFELLLQEPGSRGARSPPQATDPGDRS